MRQKTVRVLPSRFQSNDAGGFALADAMRQELSILKMPVIEPAHSPTFVFDQCDQFFVAYATENGPKELAGSSSFGPVLPWKLLCRLLDFLARFSDSRANIINGVVDAAAGTFHGTAPTTTAHNRQRQNCQNKDRFHR
jgi:hypothetical protein